MLAQRFVSKLLDIKKSSSVFLAFLMVFFVSSTQASDRHLARNADGELLILRLASITPHRFTDTPFAAIASPNRNTQGFDGPPSNEQVAALYKMATGIDYVAATPPISPTTPPRPPIAGPPGNE